MFCNTKQTQTYSDLSIFQNDEAGIHASYQKENPKLHHALQEQIRSNFSEIVQTCFQNVKISFNA